MKNFSKMIFSQKIIKMEYYLLVILKLIKKQHMVHLVYQSVRKKAHLMVKGYLEFMDQVKNLKI
jgi:general stress protein 26